MTDREAVLAEVDAVMLYIEEARARAERGIRAARGCHADAYVIEALSSAMRDLSEVARALRHRAVFVAPERSAGQYRREPGGPETADVHRDEPQTDEELAGLDDATRALIREEPW